LANDLYELVTNLRAYGVLFFPDSASRRQAKPPEHMQPARQTRIREDSLKMDCGTQSFSG
jgi:hypothetical protein